MNIKNNKAPCIDPWGTPEGIFQNKCYQFLLSEFLSVKKKVSDNIYYLFCFILETPNIFIFINKR